LGGRASRSRPQSGSPAQPDLTFFIDECLGKALGEALRSAGYAVRTWHEEGLGGAPDAEWLPKVCEQGWVVLTSDAAVRKNVEELRAIMTQKGRVFIVSGASRRGKEKVDLVLGHAQRIMNLSASRRAPFIARVLAGGVEIVQQPKKHGKR